MPGAEVCDGMDNDCDGTIDEDAADAKMWYRDCDGDGYGIVAGSVKSCTTPVLPSGCKAYVTLQPTFPTTLDCRDNAKNFHPGVTMLTSQSQYLDDQGSGFRDPLWLDVNCDNQTTVAPYGFDLASGKAYPVCTVTSSCAALEPCIQFSGLNTVENCLGAVAPQATLWGTGGTSCSRAGQVGIMCL